MELVLLALALVLAKLDRRTETDRRIRRLDATAMLRIVAKQFGYSVGHADDGLLYITGLPCREKDCGATWHDRENHPSMRYDSRGANYPGTPEYTFCTVCGFSRETAAALFSRLCTKNVAKILDLWAVTRLHLTDYTAIRCAGKQAIGESFRATAELIAPKRFDPESDFEAVLIRAISLSVASEALKSDSFPADAWVTVPVTHELTPKRRWHEQPMTETDAAPIRQYGKRQIREAEAAVEAEVQAFRAEAVARQRA